MLYIPEVKTKRPCTEKCEASNFIPTMNMFDILGAPASGDSNDAFTEEDELLATYDIMLTRGGKKFVLKPGQAFPLIDLDRNLDMFTELRLYYGYVSKTESGERIYCTTDGYVPEECSTDRLLYLDDGGMRVLRYNNSAPFPESTNEKQLPLWIFADIIYGSKVAKTTQEWSPILCVEGEGPAKWTPNAGTISTQVVDIPISLESSSDFQDEFYNPVPQYKDRTAELMKMMMINYLRDTGKRAIYISLPGFAEPDTELAECKLLREFGSNRKLIYKEDMSALQSRSRYALLNSFRNGGFSMADLMDL